MPMLILIVPLIACYLDIARPPLPHFHHNRNIVYVPRDGAPMAVPESPAALRGVLDLDIEAGPFGIPPAGDSR